LLIAKSSVKLETIFYTDAVGLEYAMALIALPMHFLSKR
jgi:hypothetical protein